MTIAVATQSSRDVESEHRVDAIDWTSASAQLDAYRWAMIEKMLSAETTRSERGRGHGMDRGKLLSLPAVSSPHHFPT
jgi:hypothetical protein